MLGEAEGLVEVGRRRISVIEVAAGGAIGLISVADVSIINVVEFEIFLEFFLSAFDVADFDEFEGEAFEHVV